MSYSFTKHKKHKLYGQVPKDIFMEYLNLFKSLGGGYVRGDLSNESFFFYPREEETDELKEKLDILWKKELGRIKTK